MNNLSLELLNRLTNPDAIVRSGYRSFPSYVKNLPWGIAGLFSGGRNLIEISKERFNDKSPKGMRALKNIIAHEGRHAGLRQLMRDYGTTGYNKGFAPKETFTKEQQRALSNRDLEKFAGLLGYRGNPNSDTLFNLGEYEKDDKGNWTYVLDDDRMLAGVIPVPKSKKDKAEDAVLKSFGFGVKEIKPDMDFEHSIVYDLPRNIDIDTSKLNFETRVSPENYRAIRAIELYNKLLDLRKRKP
jgi:hypothetical protein